MNEPANHTPPTVERKHYQSANAPAKAERAWFEDEENGYHAEINLDGQTFQIREVSDAQIKVFGANERKTAQALQALAAEQKKATEAADGNLEPEQAEAFSQRSADLLAQQFANSDELLTAALVGWSLPRELNPDNIRRLSKSARRRLAELVGQRSTLGADEQSFLVGRSRK